MKSRDGAELKLTLKNDVRIGGVVKASLAGVKPDANVAITSRPRPDGTFEAVELRIAPGRAALQLIPFRLGFDAEQLYDQRLIATSISGVDGQVLTVKYKVQGKADQENEDCRNAEDRRRHHGSRHQGGPQARLESVRCRCPEAA